MQRRPSLLRSLLLAAFPLSLLCAAAGACSLTAPSDEELVTSCDDDAKNGDETDVDCGGSCGPCGTGRTCKAGTDCVSGACPGNVCEPPSCSDGVKNGDESDIDCGGFEAACDYCAAGKSCSSDDDCTSFLCEDGVCATACDDGALSGDETDVDCGGSCPAKCQTDQGCFENTDCVSGVCTEDLCQ